MTASVMITHRTHRSLCLSYPHRIVQRTPISVPLAGCAEVLGKREFWNHYESSRPMTPVPLMGSTPGCWAKSVWDYRVALCVLCVLCVGGFIYVPSCRDPDRDRDVILLLSAYQDLVAALIRLQAWHLFQRQTNQTPSPSFLSGFPTAKLA